MIFPHPNFANMDWAKSNRCLDIFVLRRQIASEMIGFVHMTYYISLPFPSHQQFFNLRMYVQLVDNESRKWILLHSSWGVYYMQELSELSSSFYFSFLSHFTNSAYVHTVPVKYILYSSSLLQPLQMPWS